jgi:hypothetical protein
MADDDSQPDTPNGTAKSAAEAAQERPNLGDVTEMQGNDHPLHWQVFREMTDEQLEHELNSLRQIAGGTITLAGSRWCSSSRACVR